jgi:hypothetical protein
MVMVADVVVPKWWWQNHRFCIWQTGKEHAIL